MSRPITVVARIPRNPTSEERIKAASSWPVRVSLGSDEDAAVHARWWRPRSGGFLTLVSVMQIPERMRKTFDALKSLLRSEVSR